MNVIKIPDEIFSIGILHKEFHGRLLADIERVADTAGIPVHYIWSRLSQYCEEADVAWVKSMRQGEDHGLAYVGKFKVPIEDKMMAITGACLRNYIDARMMPVQEVVSLLKKDAMPSPTVLLIPNFCMDKSNGGDIPQWQVSSLLGLLYGRLARGLKTVLYIGSLDTLEVDYGASFRKHIEHHYTVI